MTTQPAQQTALNETPLFYGCFDGLRGLEIAMTLEQAQSCSHQGSCDDDVAWLVKQPSRDHETRIANQRPGAVQCSSAGDYYRKVATRILEGYTKPNYWYPAVAKAA